MFWNKNEMVIAMGLEEEFGSKIKNVPLNIFTIFLAQQNREEVNGYNTLKLKMMNIEAMKNDMDEKSGGLKKSSLYREVLNSDWRKKYKKFIDIANKMAYPSTKVKIKKMDSDYRKLINIDSRDFSPIANDEEILYESTTLNEYISGIKGGQYKVPLFQREITWTGKQIIQFLNAIYVGSPFGNITVWEADSNILSSRNSIVEDFIDDNVISSGLTKWIIDGQQRTTAILSIFVHPKNWRKTKDIIFSLVDNCFRKRKQDDENYIVAKDLLDFDYDTIKIANIYNINLNDITPIWGVREKIYNTKIGVTNLKKMGINRAIEIFTDMNTAGTKLSLFDIVHAKWQSSNINYNLENYILNWIEDSNYKKRGNAKLTILKAIYIILHEQNISSEKILKYEVTEKDIKKFESGFIKKVLDDSVDFLLNDMQFKPELIPSSNLIRYISFFFSKTTTSKVTEKQLKSLITYTSWACSDNR